jgi:hypothetical protein
MCDRIPATPARTDRRCTQLAATERLSLIAQQLVKAKQMKIATRHVLVVPQ